MEDQSAQKPEEVQPKDFGEGYDEAPEAAEADADFDVEENTEEVKDVGE